MKIKKGIALLISLALMIGTVLPGTLALSADQASGSGTVEVSAETLAPAPDAEEAPALEETVAPALEETVAPASEETVAPASEETPAPDEPPTKEPDQTCTCDPAPAEGEAHQEGCPLYTAPKQPAEEEKACTCDPAPAEGEAHKEGCPLYEAPECTCGAAEGELHKEGCPLYTAPEAEDYTDLFNRFLEAQTYEEFDAIYQELTEEERTAFAAWLTENDKMEAIQAHFSQLYIVDEPQEEEPIVPFTNVGPLLAAPVARPRMLRAPSKAGDNSGIVLNKTAAVNSDGSYTITLEAYATGETTTTVTHQPVDIVLVLDVSGSMDETFGRITKVYDDGSLDQSKTYYVSYYGGYTAVTWNSDKNSWGYWSQGLFGTYWKDFTPKISSSDSRNTQFYTATKKIDALKTAVNGFIDSVAAQSPDSNIAIVKFAGDKIGTVGNDTYWEDGYQYNNSQIVSNLTAAGTGVDGLKNAVNALNPAGATAADYGMQHAQSIISGAADDGKKKVVIMFTDGEPNHGNGFNTSVANAAINASKGIKDNGATVYTIGVFSGANGAPVTSLSGVDDTNKYMHLVSSNYKYATSMRNTGDSTYPGGDKSYFLSASNASELSAIFQSISQEVGGATTTLDGTATIKDIVSPYFTMPAAAENITVKTAESNGSTESWKEAAAFNNGKVSIDTASSAVSVSGFSFKDNWCGNQKDAGGNITFHNGKKLIIEFKVSRKEGFLGGNDVPTNGENSGIYDKDGTEVKKFDVPTVNVPIQNVTVNAENKNVYLKGEVTAAQLQEGAVVKVGDVELNLSKADQNYGLQSWQTKYVNITVKVKVKDKDGNEISADSLKNLTDDKTYTVEVTVAPTTEGESTPEKGNAATAETGKNDPAAKINVFKPELTFKDSTAYYGENVPASNDYSSNRVGEEKWMHNGTEADTSKMLGTKPTLNISYAPDETKLADGKYTKQDVPVSATVKIDTEDVNEHTTFVHDTCTETGCSWTDDPMAKGAPAFLIHVKTCTLNITKQGGANDESYVFDVYKDGEDGKEKYSEVTVWGNGTETLVELPVGTYTIRENTGWSWRYTPSYSDDVVLSADNSTGSITCTNKIENHQWLNGFSTVVRNIYNQRH